MIVFKDTKGFQTRSDKPNENWTDENCFVVEDNSVLANKIIENYPYYEFVVKSGELVDIVELEKPPKLPELPTETQLLTDYIIDVDYRVTMVELGLI